MKMKLLPILALAVAGISCTKEIDNIPGSEQTVLMDKLTGGSEDQAQPGTLLVRFDEKTSSLLEKNDEAVTREILGLSGAESISPALMIRPKNMEVARKYGLHQWYTISFDESRPLKQVAAKMASSPSVTSLQYNTYLQPVRAEQAVGFIPTPQTRTSPVPQEEPGFDDPYSSHQWNLVNTGELTGSVAGADVSVRNAWKLTAGDPSVVVAVFDCAVNHRHEDLKDAVWVNEKELNGSDDVDDDGNGFIDDIYGFNFVQCIKINQDLVEGVLGGSAKAEAVKGKKLDYLSGIGHGTHVAGIVGATNGNGKGISSIAGGSGNNDGVRLMSCQIFQGTGSEAKNATDAQTAMAYIYAADNGACIAQCSYGNYLPITSDQDYINGNKDLGNGSARLENLALQYFLDPANSNHESLEGNIAVFASGNHQTAYSSYPGAYSYVLSVTAFGMDFQPAGYTNYGPGCKISAPGGEWTGVMNDYSGMILSTGVNSQKNPYPGIQNTNGMENKNYVYMQGTSMACPHVSGVIALGLSYAKKLGKKFTREEFTSLLLTSVTDLDQFNKGGIHKFYSPFSTAQGTDIDMDRFKGRMGTGAVDAWRFLMAIEGTPTLLAQAGKKMSIDISRYCNPLDDYTVSVDEEARTSLGLVSDPVIRNGKLEIECSKIGSGKITLSGKVGKDPEREDGIGDMGYSRELSIASRPFATSNGGWL